MKILENESYFICFIKFSIAIDLQRVFARHFLVKEGARAVAREAGK